MVVLYYRYNEERKGQVNIYISTSLRSQMKEYGDTINWSKVAADAFVSAMQQEKDRIDQRHARRRLTQRAYSWINEGT
jgi:hypothetical protein